MILANKIEAPLKKPKPRQPMKIQVKNLGPLKEAEFEVADLTIICGGNNTGKTYATYALFGFLHTWREMVSIDVDLSSIEILKRNGTITISLEKYLSQSQKIINEICQKYSDQLPNLFAASPQSFHDVSFNAFIEEKNSEWFQSPRAKTITAVSTDEVLEMFKKANSLDCVFTLKRDRHLPSEIEWSAIPLETLSSWVLDEILGFLFGKVIPSVFIASVERTGISVFRKEIDESRNILLENMSRANTSDIRSEIFIDRYQNYPLPIKFGLNFNRSIGRRYNQVGFLQKKHPNILEDFADIIGGEYKFNEHNELYYSPKISSGMRLSIYESSSAVRSLLDLGFYLRIIARPGSLLIIDEPELNLHPENQRRIARLLARLVNIGIKVFITTHSDYIIKELNTLIMLNHDKPHLKKIAEQEGYKPEELIAAERIKVYIAENSTLVTANIDPEMGIEARSFDTTIEDMNRIQESIVWGEE
jgi:AAA ATPase domain